MSSTARNKSVAILLTASVVLITLVLFLRFLAVGEELDTISTTINMLKDKLDESTGSGPFDPSEGTDAADTGTPAEKISDPRPSDWVFEGFSFFEYREIIRFQDEQILETGKGVTVFPPKRLYAMPVDEGIRLSWKPDPRNQEAVKKLAGNPLLHLTHKIYRWTKKSRPTKVTDLPVGREYFLDSTISPARETYYYSVLLALEGTVGNNKILQESKSSEVVSVVSNDRFLIEISEGDADSVRVNVVITNGRRSYKENFTVSVGQAIGAPVDVAGVGQLDFSTGLTLRKISIREEEREFNVKNPVFNSDGSVLIDLATELPVYRETGEIRSVKTISIECVDRAGKTRIFEES